MDDVDRLYFEFVEILRRQRPAALEQPIAVSELTGRLIPYARVRNLVGFRSNDDYEAALSRLLSGERGYVLSEGPMQEELRAGLEEPLPDIRRYRAFSESRVWLNPDEIPPPGDIRYAPPELRERAARIAPADAGDGDVPDELPTATSTVESELQAADTDAGTSSDSGAEGAPATDAPASGEAPTGSAELRLCPGCGADLPSRALFCPFCGYRLAPVICPSCGAELETFWRFCARCGTPRGGSA